VILEYTLPFFWVHQGSWVFCFSCQFATFMCSYHLRLFCGLSWLWNFRCSATEPNIYVDTSQLSTRLPFIKAGNSLVLQVP